MAPKLLGMDLDSLFSYTTTRALVIRDWRLGAAGLGLKFAIFCYLILYQIILQQAYRRDSAISVSLRTRVRQGAEVYQWRNGSAPFCLGVTALSHASALLESYYALSPDGLSYTYRGPIGSANSLRSGGTYARRNCSYFDEAAAAPLQESDRTFILTENRVTPQVWSDSRVPCASSNLSLCTPCPSAFVTAPECDYQPFDSVGDSVTARSYIPDVEFFTINIDHSFVAPQANNLRKSGKEMTGQLLDNAGARMDPCMAYLGLGLECPAFVASFGKGGEIDILPMRALMLAAGVESLDELSGSDKGPQTSSMRQQGLVLILDISYTNYALGNIPNPTPGGPELGGVGFGSVFTDSTVQYTYRVFAAPATQFQFQLAEAALPGAGQSPLTAAQQRFFERRYGVRLLITTGGRIGSFFFQTLLVNLVAGLALLGISSTILEFVIFSLCPLRGLFRQLRDRDTVSISELRLAAKKNPKEFQELVECVHLPTRPAFLPLPPALTPLSFLHPLAYTPQVFQCH